MPLSLEALGNIGKPSELGVVGYAFRDDEKQGGGVVQLDRISGALSIAKR